MFKSNGKLGHDILTRKYRCETGIPWPKPARAPFEPQAFVQSIDSYRWIIHHARNVRAHFHQIHDRSEYYEKVCQRAGEQKRKKGEKVRNTREGHSESQKQCIFFAHCMCFVAKLFQAIDEYLHEATRQLPFTQFRLLENGIRDRLVQWYRVNHKNGADSHFSGCAKLRRMSLLDLFIKSVRLAEPCCSQGI